jgi:hypothetical protein
MDAEDHVVLPADGLDRIDGILNPMAVVNPTLGPKLWFSRRSKFSNGCDNDKPVRRRRMQRSWRVRRS